MRSSAPAKPSQERKFEERRLAEEKIVVVGGYSFVALPNVYDTSTDTELMADVVSIEKDQNFIEIGCGTGVVTILIAFRAKSGIGVDINSEAIRNANLNKERHNVNNVSFIKSDVFDEVEGTFDVVICNPPYNAYTPKDEVEMMFWDKENQMKIKFFQQLPKYIKSGGKVYFGWADFADLDQEFPLKFAKKAGLNFVKRYERIKKKEDRMFYVYEFEKVIK
jgi:release factor glutamine methyltransferase